jgi:competence protein ComEC
MNWIINILIIISVGKNNRYGHPNKEVLDNLNNSIIYRTDLDGSIMLRVNNMLIMERYLP